MLLGAACSASADRPAGDPAPPAPLFRDPVFDGAADPSLIWNDKERAWWVFYTNRRANAPDAQDGVRWCHGTDIGIASSADGGRTWNYRGTAKGLEFEPGRNTFWAPCLLEHGRTYHMFVAYVRGVPADWSGDRHIVHYTSRDLVEWKHEGVLSLSSDRVIDAFVHAKPSGGWRMWYKDEAHGSHIYAADSEDLFRWTVAGPVVAGQAQEGAAVFWWKGSYWMLVDRWRGMGVLRSPDLENWTEQPAVILGVPGRRPDDGDIGRHGEVVVQGPEAYLFYFTHPFGPKAHTEPGKHRSSLQVARLELRGGALACDRDRPFPLALVPPSGFRPLRRPESPLELETPDARLKAAFDWAKGQALDYVFPAAVHGDPVGDWYEAALPSRFAFCMRDVSHQAAGAHALGLAAFNRNMLGKFARAISPARDFCSYWEIDKWDRPAPVDYKSDKDFWYNLTANFDVLDACWRQFLWTGDRAYVEDPAFLGFYRSTVEDYAKAWDKDDDGVPEHRPGYGYRGLGGYDEGPFSDNALYGSDLIAAMARAFDSYAGLLEVRGEGAAAAGLRERASGLRRAFEGWWSDEKGKYADGRVQGGGLVHQDLIWNGVFPLYFGFIPSGPRRDATLRRVLKAKPEGIEIESYLPEVLYRYGRDDAAYARILSLADPAKERREYPEVPFALLGAVATGLMGVRPDARTAAVETRSALAAATPWAELRDLPVLDGAIDVRHEGRGRTTLFLRTGGPLAWKAVFEGLHEELTVDGAAREANQGKDEAGRSVSWVTVEMRPGRASAVAVPDGPRRWTAEKARAWAAGRPWTLGCNYIPRTAVNTLEMWQAETFDPATIDQELGWAEELGFNAVRVFLHYLPWERDRGGYLDRLERFLALADKHHIATMFVLFDDCWKPEFKPGPQPAPRPGVHNSGWVQCPGPDFLENPERWGVLEAYTTGVIGRFRHDRRVLAWDLYNEPGNSDYGARSLALLEKVFGWARSARPAQPLTVGIWDDSKELAELNRFQAANSDIISFHSYQSRAGAEKRAASLRTLGRPLVCTEYMARTAGSRFEDILPLFKAGDVGAMNWGFVSGKTQTIFPWGSKEGSPEPAVWFHDILRPDGSPYLAAETELIRRLAGKTRPEKSLRTKAVTRPFHAWALTPPMGWNSWDSFGQAVTEAEVKSNADFMAARLAKLGWRYVVVDIEWSEPQRLGPDYPTRSKSEVDAFGRFVPAVNRFPSSAGGRGFRPLADYVHRKGLKFGVHIVRGIPRLAVERNTPIEGTALRAADIADRTDHCDWNEDQWGVDVKKPGAQEWYDSLFRLLASWGVDFVKADDLCYRGEEIAMLRRAIDRTGRPIVLSLSYGPMPIERAGELAGNANMWRLLGDLWDYWDQVLPAFRRLHDWSPHAGPGHWPDPDMLPLGHLRFLPPGWSRNRTMNEGYFAMTSHGGLERVANFLSGDEQRTVMTLWTIARAPLMFGGHLPATDAATLELITNAEVLAVNQRSRGNRQLFHATGLAAWTAEDPGTGAVYVAVFNTSDREARGPEAGVAVPVRLADLGLEGDVAVTEVWSGKSVGVFAGEFAPVVPYHGAGLYRLTRAK